MAQEAFLKVVSVSISVSLNYGEAEVRVHLQRKKWDSPNHGEGSVCCVARGSSVQSEATILPYDSETLCYSSLASSAVGLMFSG